MILKETCEDDYSEFTEILKSIRNVNTCVAGKTVKGNVSEAISIFKCDYKNLQKKFGVSKTPKIHIIEDHIEEYVQMTNHGLGYCTDQTIEALHQVVNRRFSSSKYYVKYIESDRHPDQLLRGILHVNAYNI